MAVSISSAQASALNDGFLDILGEDAELQPRNSLDAIVRLAGELVESAQNNLNKAERVATGSLSDSIKVLNPKIEGNKMVVEVEANYYYQFIDKGVKGTKGGSGDFSFKNDKPGRKMTTEIRKWLIKEGLKARTVRNEKLKAKTAKKISKRETKRKSITETSNSVAYVIAKSIKQKGLKRTNFMTKAIRETKAKAKEEIGKGFKLDIIAMLPKKIN